MPATISHFHAVRCRRRGLLPKGEGLRTAIRNRMHLRRRVRRWPPGDGLRGTERLDSCAHLQGLGGQHEFFDGDIAIAFGDKD